MPFTSKYGNTPLHQVLQKDSAIQDYWIDFQNTVLYLTVGEKQPVTKYNIKKSKSRVQTNVPYLLFHMDFFNTK